MFKFFISFFISCQIPIAYSQQREISVLQANFKSIDYHEIITNSFQGDCESYFFWKHLSPSSSSSLSILETESCILHMFTVGLIPVCNQKMELLRTLNKTKEQNTVRRIEKELLANKKAGTILIAQLYQMAGDADEKEEVIQSAKDNLDDYETSPYDRNGPLDPGNVKPKDSFLNMLDRLYQEICE